MAMLAYGVQALSAWRASRQKPRVPDPIPMPDEEALQKQKKRSLAAASGSGRASTILTGTDNGLGG